MKLRSPSIGFLYLLLTAAGAVAFFNYLTGPFFFEHKPRSEAAEIGEARYLLKLGRQDPGKRGKGFLNTARDLAERHQDEDLVREIDSLLKINQPGFVEVQPGVLIAGFDKQGRTKGPAAGTVRLINPTDTPLRVLLKFGTEGKGRGEYVINGKTTHFDFAGDSGELRGNFLTPPVAPHQSVDILVSIHRQSSNAQLSGLRFIAAEPRP